MLHITHYSTMVSSVDVLTISGETPAEVTRNGFSVKMLVSDSIENVKNLAYNANFKEYAFGKVKRRPVNGHTANNVKSAEELDSNKEKNNINAERDLSCKETETLNELLPQMDDQEHGIHNEQKLWGLLPVPMWSWLHDHEYSIPSKEYPMRRRSSSGSKKSRIHQHADSLFSSTSGFTDFSGFFNLCMILLILSNLRVALENIIKYGILIQPLAWLRVMIREPYSWPSFVLFLCCNIFILITLWVEKALSKGIISEKTGILLHIINMTAEIAFPAAVVWIRHPFPMFSSVTLASYVVIFLKLVSYIQVNGWCRAAQNAYPSRRLRSRNKSVSAALNTFAEENEIQENIANGKVNGYMEKLEINKYPRNLTFHDLYYFMVAPTLCYELHFPRSARIRKRFLLRRLAEMVFLSALIVGLVQQWIIPTVHNSMVPFKEMDITRIFERLLKLAVPNHIIWLIFFYCFFHSILNVIGELTRFGDRTFYQDWWNATTVEQFWQLWNIPVHKWAVRHLYKPMIANKFHKKHAAIAVFLVSAFFHEYLVSIPLRMFRIWAFSAMISQVPMAMLTRKYLPGRYGNIAVWFSLIIGQPSALLMYYHDYYVINKGIWSL